MWLVMLGLLASPTWIQGQAIPFSDDFEGDELEDGWIITNYVREDSGSLAPFSELQLVQVGGELRVLGTCQIDTRTVDGQTVGWIGRAAMRSVVIPMTAPLALETDVRIVRHRTSTGAPSQVQFHLTLEFDPDNRVLLTFGQTSRGRDFQLVFDENDSVRDVQIRPFPFVDGEWYRLRMEFDPETGQTRGLIDGNLLLEARYRGVIRSARVGLAGAVRYRGDTIDLRADQFSLFRWPVLFRRGDVDADGKLNVTDPVALLSWLFRGGSEPPCLDGADANDDGVIDLSDTLGLLGYLFLGSLPPTIPFRECGVDPTEDDLPCEDAPGCEGV